VTWVPSDTKALVYDLIRSGLESCSDTAEQLGITTSSVSEFATRLMGDELIKKQGHRYVLA
jgi:predicted transcriptional regulator